MRPGERKITVVKQKDGYYRRTMEKGKYLLKKMDPQPNEKHVLGVRRVYATHKADKSFKRRITTFENVPEHLQNNGLTPSVSLVEYVGTMPESTIHGNSLNSTALYVRPHPETLSKIKTQLETKKRPRDIYIDLLENEDIHKTAKKIRQVHDMKHRNATEKNNGAHNYNFADEIQQVITKLSQPDTVVQHVSISKNQVPCVILYSSQNLDTMRTNCFRETHPSILGIDRTFNLGKVYVTVTSFKNSSVVNSRGCSPIIIGPMLLHSEATSEIYGAFLHFIMAGIGFEHVQNLIIGCDDEPAIRKAIKNVLPQATNILCTRHLRDNFDNNLKNKEGVNRTNRNVILDKVFGSLGMANAPDPIVFESLETEVQQYLISLNAVKAVKYFNDRISPLVHEFVFKPHQQHCHIPFSWSNNNSESANHVIKSHNEWKLLSLPHLVDKLAEIVKLQDKDVSRALVGFGNFNLANHMLHHRISVQRWTSMSLSERCKRIEKFVKDSRVFSSESRLCQSTDQKLVIKKPTNSRKPSQRKRPRAEKSFSITNNKALMLHSTKD